ncbi:hypothetical protein F5Y10DRAFT_290643, partial [Nemania abortiva]
MQMVVEGAKASSFPSLRSVLRMHPGDRVLRSYGLELVKRLLGGGKSVDEAVWTIIPTAAAASSAQAHGWAQMIGLYLSDEYCSHWPAIQELASFGVLRTVVLDRADVKDGSRIVSVKNGDTIFTDFVAAGLDASKFPDPYEIKLDRPEKLYIYHGWGPHACLGRPVVTTAAASMLRVCARLGSLRRSPGPAGEMKSKTVNGAFKVYLAEDGSKWEPVTHKSASINTPSAKMVTFDKADAVRDGYGSSGNSDL